MDGADKAHDAREASATSDVPVTNAPRQSFAPTAVMQSPQSLGITIPPKISNMGNCVLTKRKHTVPPASRENSTSTTYPTTPQSPFEQFHVDNSSMPTSPTTDSKKRKTQNEPTGLGLPVPLESDLFVPLALTQRLKQQKTTLLKEAEIACEIELREQEGNSKYFDRQEKKNSGLAIDDPMFRVYRQAVWLIAAYLETEVQKIRDQTGGLQGFEVKTILSRCAQYKGVNTAEELLDIFIWGPAGHGKSTVLNCLLNCPDAAINSGGGKSCTNVKHQYFYTAMPQDGQYRAVVEFTTETALRTIVEYNVDRILAYQRLLVPDEDDKSTRPALTVDWEELDEQDRDSSLDILAGLTVQSEADHSFGSRSDLKTFVESRDLKETAIKERFVAGAVATLKRHAGDGGERKYAAESLIEVLYKCGRFSRPIEGQDLALWMLVKQISIWIPAFILEISASFIDGPGILDTNQIRRLIANSTFDSCNTVMLVQKYERAADSTLLDDSLKRCVSADKNVIVVLTIVDVAAKDGKSKWGNSEMQDESTFGEELGDDTLRQLVYELRETKRELTRPGNTRSKPLKDQRSALVDKVYKRRIVVKRSLITRTLQEKHRRLQSSFNSRVGKKLSVHCTCAPDYERHMEDHDEEDDDDEDNPPPGMSAEETGIPALRNEVRSLRADIDVQDLKDLVSRNGLTRVVNAFEFYCDHSTLELEKLIKRSFIEPKDRFIAKCDELSNQLGNEIENTTNDAQTKAGKVSKRHGNKLHKDWARLHQATYRAHCEKGGEHRHKDGDNLVMVSWNKEIMAGLEDLIISTFMHILRKINVKQGAFLSLVDGFLDPIVVSLKGTADAGMNEHLDAFYDRIEQLREDAKKNIRKQCASLEERINKIRTEALRTEARSVDKPESYLVQAMQETYGSVKGVKGITGPGSKEKRMSRIQAKLTDENDNVFLDVMKRCTADLRGYFDQWAIQLRKCLHVAIFAQAEKQFHENRPAEDQPVSPEEEHARGLVLQVVKEVREELVKLQKDVAELEARCDSKRELLED